MNYRFSILSERRIIKEEIIGLWDKQIAMQYTRDFQKTVAPLLGKPWAKIVDLNQWKTSRQEVVEIIGKHLQWARTHQMAYSANILSDIVARNQLKRMFREGGTSEFSEVFETEKVALNWLKSNGF